MPTGLSEDPSGTVARRAPLNGQEQIALAERIRSGDAAAEAELVRQYGRPVLIMMQVGTRDREAARDLVQDVLLAVLVAVRDGRLRAGDHLAAFVHGTARNRLHDFLRARARQPRAEPLDESAACMAVAADPEAAERVRLMHRVLDRLAPPDREILVMTLIQGMAPREIAARLGLTSEVVRARKSRATKQIIERVRKSSRR